MRRLRRWYIPACRGQRGPAGRANPQAGAGLRAGARRGRPAAPIAAAVYVSPELYSLPVYQEFASLRPPLGGRTRLVIYMQFTLATLVLDIVFVRQSKKLQQRCGSRNMVLLMSVRGRFRFSITVISDIMSTGCAASTRAVFYTQ